MLEHIHFHLNFRLNNESIGNVVIYNNFAASKHKVVQDMNSIITTDNEQNSFFDKNQNITILISKEDSLNLKSDKLYKYFKRISIIE